MIPLVSIIIPVYNAETYLSECIESALNQSWANKEIIVVNDGSSDNSLEIASRYQERGVTIISQENKGASAARNKGLEYAKGGYIQFLDADDLLDADKIRDQMELLNGRIDTLALGPTIHFQEEEKPSLQNLRHEWYSAGSKDNVDFLVKLYGGAGAPYGGMIQPNSWLSPRQVVDAAGPWNERLSLDDDGEYFCRAILASRQIVYAPQALNFYRKYKRSNNLSADKSRKAFNSALLSTDLKASALLAVKKDDLIYKMLCRLYMEIAVSSYPAFRDISCTAEQKAKNYAKPGDGFFDHTPFYKFISRYFGWKASAWISYLKNNKLRSLIKSENV